jgi:hypothetical protein
MALPIGQFGLPTLNQPPVQLPQLMYGLPPAQAQMAGRMPFIQNAALASVLGPLTRSNYGISVVNPYATQSGSGYQSPLPGAPSSPDGGSSLGGLGAGLALGAGAAGVLGRFIPRPNDGAPSANFGGAQYSSGSPPVPIDAITANLNNLTPGQTFGTQLPSAPGPIPIDASTTDLSQVSAGDMFGRRWNTPEANASNQAAPSTGSSILGTASNVARGLGGAYGVYSGLEQGGARGYGSALASGANLAGLAGYGGTGTSALGAAGNIASGNYLGAAKNVVDILGGGAGGATAASLGLGNVASGAAANAALGEAGFGTGAATAGTGAATGGLGSAIAGSGLSTALPLVGLGYALTSYLNAGPLNDDKSKTRNIDAYTQFTGAKPIQLNLGRTAQTYYAMPDGTLVSNKDFNDLAGSWYGATYAPDGDQAGWQQKYAGFQQSIGPAQLPKGYVYKDGKIVRG